MDPRLTRKDPPEWQYREAELMFESICESFKEVFRKKNREYGNAVDACGLSGAVIELVGITGRLIELVLMDPNNGKGNEEAILDKLLDAHNYANIGVMQMNKGIYTGNLEYLKERMREWLQEK